MTPTFIVVPVRDQWEMTSRFLDMLSEHAWDDLLVIDNGSVDGSLWRLRERKQYGFEHKRMHVFSRPGRSIYEMWSEGFARAKRLAAGANFNALVLNNDVELYPDTVGVLAHHLRIDEHRQSQDPSVWVTYPDVDAAWPVSPLTRYHLTETRGVFGDGGMFGPCFMLRGEAIYWQPLITDPAYAWWYGDNHLAECIELAGGRQMRVVGLPIKHVNEGTAQHHDLYAAKLQDRGRFITRHQRGYGVAP